MPIDGNSRYDQIQELLTKLDLSYHSLRLVGQNLVSQVAGSSTSLYSDLYTKSVQLSKECSTAISDVSSLLGEQVLGLRESTLNRIALAMRRASKAKSDTLRAVQVWRVIETTDQYLASVAPKYGYVRLSQETALEEIQKRADRDAQLVQVFREYHHAMSKGENSDASPTVPFSHGILRWRGRQLYYGQRFGDGVRWIELDPDYERKTIVQEQKEEGVELLEAKTIEGYTIELRLDPKVDESMVSSYLRRQKLSPYIASGAQIAEEQRKARRPRGSRR
jgi:hypothetical protein